MTLATFKTKTGRGTFEVRTDPFTGRLACTCGQPDCEHLTVGALAESAGAAFREDGTLFVGLGTFPSSSGHGVYDAKCRVGSEALSCNCRGWIYHKKCKHVAEVMARQMIDIVHPARETP